MFTVETQHESGATTITRYETRTPALEAAIAFQTNTTPVSGRRCATLIDLANRDSFINAGVAANNTGLSSSSLVLRRDPHTGGGIYEQSARWAADQDPGDLALIRAWSLATSGVE